MGTVKNIGSFLAAIFFGSVLIVTPCQCAMEFGVQLNNYTNPTFSLAAPGMTCGITSFGRLALICNLQFTTIISFVNSPPVTISTHLIPFDNNSMIVFNNTAPVTNCPPNPATNFHCADQTWQVPHRNMSNNNRPKSIHVVVTHFGGLAYNNTIVPDAFVPQTSWYVDTYYLDLEKIVPSPNNATPRAVTYLITGTQNIGQLGITFYMQCLGGYWGLNCAFSSCQSLSDDYWKCKTANDSGYRYLCPKTTENSTSNIQPTHCEFCRNGISGNSCSLGYSSAPTNYNQKGYTAGIIVLAIVALIELIVILAGIFFYCKEKKKNQPSTRPTNTTSNYRASAKKNGNNNADKGNYRAAPIAEPEQEWSNGNRRPYSDNFPSDEYSTPSRNGTRTEAAV